MKRARTVLYFALAGSILGYWLGCAYCSHLLNTGQIYDESRHIPAEILNGSAYGKVWALWGGISGVIIGLVIVTRPHKSSGGPLPWREEK